MAVNYKFKTKPYDHQREALDRSMHRNGFGFFMEMGCVDADTEYLSPTGWCRIADYAGGKVAQFNLDGRAEFVEPLGYVKKPCPTMYHFTSARGLDQMLSGDHRMLVLRRDKQRASGNDLLFDRVHDGPAGVQVNQSDVAWYETTPEKITYHARGLSHIWPVFEGCDGNGIGLSDAEIRVQVAFHADGSYGTRDLSTIGSSRKGVVRVKRQRKIQRLQELLEAADIAYERRERDDGFVEFWFRPPLVSKWYGVQWWGCTAAQKRVVAEEVFYWDSPDRHRKTGGRSYSSIHKGDADFVQFCLASTGKRSSVRFQSDGTWVVRAVGTGRTSNLVTIKHEAKEVPTPDGFMYCFRVPTSYLVLRRNGCIFVTGNTGKSKVLIDTCSNLYLEGKISFALIIAPKGVYRNWVTKEIPEHFPDDIPHRVIRWVANPNKKQQEEMRSVKDRFEGLTFFIMNVEAFSSLKGKAAGEWMARNFGKHGLIGLDESTTIKNQKAKRSKALCKISAGFAYRRLLTGSPVTKAPMDIYAQAEFLGPRLLGFDSYYAFQGRYCVTVRRSMGAHSFQQVVGYRNLDELTESIDSFSYRVLKKDCLDLPEKVFTVRHVELTKEQAAMYKRLKKDALLMFEGGAMVSTPQVITKMLRLQQVLSGHLMTDDGELLEFPSGRLNELMSIIEETSGKVIIWSRFRNDIQRITAELRKVYGNDAASSYYGDTPDDERNQIVQDFQKPNHPLRFFVGNPATAGYGLTLTEASTVVYFANNFSLEHRMQSEDRAHRLGQKNTVTYIDLIAEGSIDEKIVESLRNKIDIGAAVLGEEAREWLKLTPKSSK
jgi:hypothetical protein